MAVYIDLITSTVHWTTAERDRFEERKTLEFKRKTGEYGNACRYDVDYGWVPEADCPIHDKE